MLHSCPKRRDSAVSYKENYGVKGGTVLVDLTRKPALNVKILVHLARKPDWMVK